MLPSPLEFGLQLRLVSKLLFWTRILSIDTQTMLVEEHRDPTHEPVTLSILHVIKDPVPKEVSIDHNQLGLSFLMLKQADETYVVSFEVSVELVPLKEVIVADFLLIYQLVLLLVESNQNSVLTTPPSSLVGVAHLIEQRLVDIIKVVHFLKAYDVRLRLANLSLYLG